MNTFDKIYRDVIQQIMTDGIKEVNKRTKHEVIALPGICFSLDIERDGFPLLSLRKQPIKSPIAEQLWFLSGSNRPAEFLQKYTKIWDKFIEEDGTVAAAYGHRWKHHFGKNQIDLVLRQLTADPSSRQGVVITWDVADDGLEGTRKKNVPCPFAFTMNIIGGRLNLMNVVRSNDMILGCPFDVTGFALLQCILAQKLGVQPGIYTHVISNAHIYDIHYDVANEIIKRPPNGKQIVLSLPQGSYDRACTMDENLVDEIFNNLKPQYNPQPDLGKLEIVL